METEPEKYTQSGRQTLFSRTVGQKPEISKNSYLELPWDALSLPQNCQGADSSAYTVS